MPLCDPFKKRSRFTWNFLRKARGVGYQLGEETLTDLHVLYLKEKHAGQVLTHTFTKPQESVTGADWEWWFGAKGGQWLGFRVQAKIIELSTSSYPHLHYKNRNTAVYQCDRLISSAMLASPRRIPLYCLYSNWDPRPHGLKSRCRISPTIRGYGCSIASAIAVRHLRITGKKTGLADAFPIMRPWFCLVCPCPSGSGGLPNVPFVHWKQQILPGDQRLRIGMGDSPDVADALGVWDGLAADPSSVLTDSPPRYVSQLLEGQAPARAPDEYLGRVTVMLD